MDDSLNLYLKITTDFLKKRTGFLGLGPSYGEIILYSLVGYVSQRFSERSVVREAEKILEEINERNKMF